MQGYGAATLWYMNVGTTLFGGGFDKDMNPQSFGEFIFTKN